MSHSSRRGSVKRQAPQPLTTRRLKQAGRQALEALESRIAPSTLVTLSAGSLGVLGDAGGGGEDESLVFTVSHGALRISDPAHMIVAGLGTVQDGAHSVLAPLASLTDSVHVFTGGGHDSVAIEGAMPVVQAFIVHSDDASSSITLHGSITAHGTDGHGGMIAVTAGRIALEGATLDASGPSGGGAILVGGDFQGGGSLAHAQFVTVDAASVLRADALSAGHGGKVIVWSDQMTSFAGQVSARGGAAGGDGGTLEVSGRELLDFRGLGNASAPHGHAGSLLLDPKNITVDSAAALGAAVTTVAFGDQTGQSVSLNPGSLTATLNTGTAVTLQASNDLTVTSAISANNPSGTGGALTLQAGRSLLLNANITTDDGALTLIANETAANGVVNADRDPGAGVIIMASGVALNAGAGTMTITMGSGAGLTNSTSGDLTLRDIVAGALSVTNQGPAAGTTLNLLGAINTTGASTFAADAVTINTTTGSVNASAVTLKPFTAGRAIDLGTKTAGTLGFTNAELGKVTAGLLQIGDGNSGAITVSTALTPISDLSLTTGAGLTFNQAVTMALNKSLTINAASATSGTISLPGANSTLAASGTGTISLTAGRSISLSSGSSITTVDGSLTLSANQQATPSTGSFMGISLAGAVVQVTGGGNLTMLGKGGDGAASQYGITIAGGRVQGGTAGLVNVQGTGGPSTGFGNYGITTSSPSSIITSSGANVQVTGVAGGVSTAGTSPGIWISAGQVSAGGMGSVTVQGTGSSANGTFQAGVRVSGSTSSITSAGGNIRVTGQGGASGTSSSSNFGVTVENGGLINAGGTGSVFVQGTGGVGGVSTGGASGVNVFNATISTTGGNIQIIGLGGPAGSGEGVGVATGGKVMAGGAGTVTVQGTGGPDGSGNRGVSVGGLITSAGGNVQVSGLAGGSGTGQFNVGVEVTSGVITAGGAGLVTVQGTGGNGTGGANDGVVLIGSSSSPGTVTSGGGAVQVTAIAGTGSGTFSLTGGYLGATFGKITTAANGGNVTLLVNNFSFMSDTVISTAAGGTINLAPTTAGRTITLGGKSAGLGLTAADLALFSTGTLNLGDAASGAVSTLGAITPAMNLTLVTNAGVTLSHAITMAANKSLAVSAPNLTSGSLSLATSSSLLTASGTGAISLTAARGISLTTGSSITTADGNLSLSGNQQATPATGTFSGISLTGAVVQVTGSGTLSLQGKGGDGVSSQSGVGLTSSRVQGGTSGLVTVQGRGGPSTGGLDHGVSLSGATSAITSGGANVQVTGQGGGTGAPSDNYGVSVAGGQISAGGTGSVTVQGTGGFGSGASQKGVAVNGSTSAITSSGGNVLVTGQGGAGAAFNYGVAVEAGAQITAGGSGSVIIHGTGGAGSSNSNEGVYVPSALITSGGGNVQVIGFGGSTGSASSGVTLAGTGKIMAGSTGTVTVQGTGGSASGSDFGVYLSGASTVITSSGGSVQVTGTGGGSGSGTSNSGVNLFSGTITAGGSGTVIVQGTAGSGTGGLNNGIDLRGPSTAPSTITSGGGAVMVSGVASSGGSYGLFSGYSGFTFGNITTAVNGGALSLALDNFQLSGDNVISTVAGGTVNLAPVTAGRGISLGNKIFASLSLSQSDFNAFSTGTLHLGSPSAGAIVTVQSFNPGTNLSLETGSTITFSHSITMAANKSLTATAPGTISTAASLGVYPSIAATGTGGISFTSGRNISLVAGIGSPSLTTMDGNLTLSANQQAVPASGSFAGILLTAYALQTTGSGTLSLLGKGGDAAGAGQQQGILMNAASKVTGGSGLVDIRATGGPSSGVSNEGLLIGGNSFITSTGGNVQVTGQGGGSGASQNNTGVEVFAGGLISAGGSGTVTVQGTGGSTTGGTNIGVSVANGFAGGATISSSGGNVRVTGQGGTGGNAYGIYLPTGGLVSAGGSGSVTMLGTGGGSSSGNYGVYMVGASGANASVTSSGGPVQITGLGGAGVGSYGINKGSFSLLSTATAGGNLTLIADTMSLATDVAIATQSTGSVSIHPNTAGIQIYAGPSIPAGSLGFSAAQLGAISTGKLQLGDANSGAITIAGALTPTSDLALTTGGGFTSSAGITLAANKSLTANAASTISVTAGNLTASGTGGISLTSARNISLAGSGSLTTVNGAITLSANQQAVPATGAFAGIAVGPYTVQSTGPGAVSLAGQGGDTGIFCDGINLINGGKVIGGSGLVDIRGTGGASSGNANYGVSITGTGSSVTSTGANVQVTGQGGGTGAGSSNFGVNLASGGAISAGGSGSVTVLGTAGNTTGGLNDGISVAGQISSSGGPVSVTGHGAGTGSGSNYGVYVASGGSVTAGGAGSVSVSGTGGNASSSFEIGVSVSVGGTITSGGGNVQVTGQGGGTGSSNFGIYVPSGTLSAGGAGTLTMMGTGGGGSGGLSNYGVYLQGFAGGGALVTSSGGPVQITGVGGAGSFNTGLNKGTFSTITTATAGGNLTLIADTLSLATDTNTTTQSSGTLSLHPFTAGTKIYLATTAPAGSLGLTTAQFATLATGTLQIGDANSGNVTIGSALAPGFHLTLTTGGSIDFNGGVSMASGKNLTATGGGALTIAGAGVALTAAGTGAISLTSAHNIAVGTGTGISTGDGDLTLSANQQTTPASGNFTGILITNAVVQATGAGRVSVTGRGGDTLGNQDGVGLASGAILRSGSGSLTVRGTGGLAPSGVTRGVFLSNSTNLITSGGGDVLVIGQGGGLSVQNYGVALGLGSTISAGGLGTVTVQGTGGSSSGNENVGVDLFANGATISSSGGNVQVTGIGGGTGSSANNYGVRIEASTQITSGTAGAVTVFGTGGTTSSGVAVTGNTASNFGTITSGGGSLTITGVAGSTASPGVTLGANGLNFSTITTAPHGGDVTVIADGISLSSVSTVVTQTGGKVTLKPLTAGTAINLGGADGAGMLGLNSTELAAISTGNLQIGSSTAGAISVNTVLSTFPNVALTSGTGSIAFGAAGSILANAGTVSLDAGPTGAVSTSDNTGKITANRLAIVAGGGIGSAAAPLGFAVTTLETDSSAGNGDQYLQGNATVGAAGLNAGTGTINLISSTFALSASNELGDLSKLKLNNATLALGAFSDTVGGVSLLSGAITGSGTLTSASAFDLQSGNVSAHLAGNVGVSKTTTGTVVLSSANSYTGATAISAGILNVQNALALGTMAGGTVVSAGGTLQLPGGFNLSGAITISGPGAAGGTGALEIVSGQVAVTVPVTLAGATNISVDANAGLTLSGGIVDTASGASDLTLAIAPGGSATLTGGVGSTVPLKSFATTGGGSLNVGGAVKTTGPQTYASLTTVAASVFTTTDSAVMFTGAASLGFDLTVNAGAGNIVFNGTVSGFGGLTANSTGSTIFNAGAGHLHHLVTDTGGTTTLNGTFVTDDLQSYGDDVVIGSATQLTNTQFHGIQFLGTTTLQGPLTVTPATDYDVTFGKAVDGAQALSLTFYAKAVFRGPVGATTPLASYKAAVGANTTLYGNVTTTGAQTYDSVYTGGAVTLTTANSPIVLHSTILNGDLTVSAGAGNVTFANSADGPFAVTANSSGTTTFGTYPGAIGSTLASLTTDAGGTTVLNGAVQTSGAQTYGDRVTGGGALTTANSPVTFGGAVQGSFSISAGTAAITFQSTVTGSAFTLVADQIHFNGGARSVSSAGDIALYPGTPGLTIGVNGGTGGLQLDLTALTPGYSSLQVGKDSDGGAIDIGNLTLGGDTTFGSLAGSITFNGPVDGGGSLPALAVDTGGTTFFASTVGAGHSLGSLSTYVGGGNTGGTILSGNVTTAAYQIYGPLVIAGPALLSTTYGQVEVDGKTILNADLRISSGSDAISLRAVDGAHALVLNSGATNYFGPVGASAPLTSITTTAFSGTTIFGNVTTTGPQSYGGHISQNTDLTVSAGSGNITFGGSIDSGQALTVKTTGATVFGGAIGQISHPTSLTIDPGAGTTLSGSVTTTSAQSYGGNLTIATGDPKGIALTTTNSPVTIGGATTLNGGLTVNTGSGAITFSGAVDGGKTLAVNTTGATVFGSAIGAVTPLTSLTTNAGGTTTLNGSVKTTGAQSYGDSLTIAAASTLATTNSAVSMLGTTLLNADLTISAGAGNIKFTGTVNGAQALVANSTGTTTLGAAVGGVTPLASLTTDAGGTTTLPVSVKTTGAQTYGDRATTATGTSGTTLSTTNSPIFFGGTTLAGNLTLTAGGGDVTFQGSVASSVLYTLTVNSTGATLFGSTVGTTTSPLGSIKTDAGGTTVLTANVTTSSSQTYGDDLIIAGPVQLSANLPVLVKGSTTLNGDLEVVHGSINFSGKVDGAHNFTIGNRPQSGSVTFGGAVGSLVPLTSVYAGSVAAINGGSVITTGDQFYGRPLNLGAAISLGASASLISTNNGVITVGGISMTSPPSASLTITTGATGAVSLFSNPGSQRLSSLNVNGAAPTTLNGYFPTTGDQTFAGPVTLAGPTSLDSSMGTVHLPRIDGAYPLTVSANQGSIDLGGEIGASAPLASLSLLSSAGSIAVNTDLIQTTGGAIFGGPTTLKQSLVINNTAGDVRFARVDVATYGGQSLTVASGHSGTVTFTAAVGGPAFMAGLTVTGAANINLGANVSTIGDQMFSGPVTLTAPVVSFSSGSVQFQKIDGADPLAVSAQAITFGGEVGSTTPLASLSLISSASPVAVNTDLIQATNGVEFDGDATLGQSLTINNTAGAVSFLSVNAATDGGQGLTVATGPSASVTFYRAVGNVHPLAGLTVSGGPQIDLWSDIATAGKQSYGGPVTVRSNPRLSSLNSDLAFGSTIDGPNQGPGFLDLVAHNGGLTFGGAIGATVPLVILTTDSGSPALALPAITVGNLLSVRTTSGAISQTGPQKVAGEAIYESVVGAIDLSSAANDFAGTVFVGTGDAGPTTVQTAHALTLSASVPNGSLSATALDGDLNVYGDIYYGSSLHLTAAGAEKSVIVSAALLDFAPNDALLQATGDIVFRNSGSLALKNGPANVTLLADSDQSHSGAVLIEAGSVIESAGGAVQIGGVDAKTPAYGSGAVYDGIALNSGVTILGELSTSGGTAQLNGHGKTDPAPQDGHNFGVLIDGHGSLTSSGTGAIGITATAGAGSAAFAMTNLYGTGTPHLGDDGSETLTGGIALYLEAADALTDPLTLNGAVIHSRGTLYLSAENSSVGIAGAAGTMNLSTAKLAQLADGFSSIQISAGGALTSNAVTFTDPVSLYGSSIDLQGTVSAAADPVSLDAGTGVITIEQAATFTVKAAGVIADGSMVHLRGGTLDLGAFNETVGGVQLFGGTINAAGGTLTSATTFELLQGAVHAPLAGKTPGVGVLKYGDFTVSLSAPSTYTGGTTIRAGTLEFSHPQALGTGLVTLGDADTGSDTAALLATAVMNDSDLMDGSQGQFNNDIYVAPYGTGKSIIGATTFDAGAGLSDRSTTFGGHLSFTKATTLQGGNSDRTTFSGVVAGSTVAVEGGARVVLSNSGDTFGSSFKVAGAGTMLQVEGNGDALFTAANVDVGQGATLALAASASHDVSLRSLSGAGTVRSALAGTPQSLYVSDPHGGGNFAGSITDGASLVSLLKFGAGTQTLSGLNTYTGGTIIKEGKLALVSTSTNNNLASSPDITVVSGATLDVTGLDKGTVLDTLVLASGQTMHGSGAIAGRLQAAPASTLAPASSSPALFSTGDLALSASSTFSATIDHTAASLDGQVNVKGTVSLGDATLHLGGAVGAASHQRIVLIQNDGTDAVVGTFHGLGEGALVPLNGVNYILSYHGGDGNDVTLEQDRSIYAVAAGVTTAGAYGLPVVNVYNARTGGEIFSITAYETKLRDGIRVAVADMNGDGYDDIITTTAVGTGRLRVFDGLTGKRFTSGPFANELAVFDGKTDIGAFVGAGDLTGDGRADLIVGSALGGGKVRVFDGVTGAALTFSTGQTFLQPFGKTFKGGIRVAAGDFNGDRVSDLALGENYYGARVAVYDGTSLFAAPSAPATPIPSPLLSFDFGPKNLRTGVNLAIGDFDHDGLSDLLVGSNAGPTYVQTYSGIRKDSAGLPQKIGTPIYPFDKSPLQHLYARGVRVASFDVNGDGIADIIAASSGLAKSVVNVYSGTDHSLLRTFAAFPALPNSALFVAASAGG